MAKDDVTLDVGGLPVVVTNPGKVFWPETGYTKLDLVNYFVAVGEGALLGIRNRPCLTPPPLRRLHPILQPLLHP